MREFWIRIDSPPAIAQGDVYPKWEQMKFSSGSGAIEYIQKRVLPQRTGSVVTLFEAKTVFSPATHVGKNLGSDEDHEL